MFEQRDHDTPSARRSTVPAATTTRRTRSPVISTLAVAAVTAAVAASLARLPLQDPWAHALGHLVGAGASAAVVVLALWFWRPARAHRASRGARGVLVAGLAVFALAQALESVGAFGFDGYRSVSALAGVHDFALYLSPVGFMLAMFGAVASAVMAGAARANVIGSRAVVFALAGAAGAVVLFFVGSVVFGY